MPLAVPGYGIVAPLGAGGVSAVFRAKQLKTGREVALKVLKPNLAGDALARERFVREGKLLKALRHPNIVEGLDEGSGALVWMALELLPGPSLLERCESLGPLPESFVLACALQALRALEHLAGLKVLHGDVKPSNLLLAGEGAVKLSDLGFASRIGKDAVGPARGYTFGTPQYIAPEQARMDSRLDGRADLYALGATLFHLLTGAPPFPGASAEEALRSQVTKPYGFERLERLGVSREACAFLVSLLAKVPSARPPGAAAARSRLEGILEARRAAAPPLELPTFHSPKARLAPVRPSARRHPRRR